MLFTFKITDGCTSEVRGRSREDDSVQALQVMLEPEKNIMTGFQVRSVEHIIQNTGALECEENARLLSSNEVQFNPNIILC